MNETKVIEFWFKHLSPRDWWRKSEQLDQDISREFMQIHKQVNAGETHAWRRTDDGRLAEIIVLDQFSRNMFRHLPAAFASDQRALTLCRDAVETGVLGRIDAVRAGFLLMPYMHSESLSVHDQGLPLFEKYCDEGTIKFERKHRDIIAQFGRYPHRNEILGRHSTAEELQFLGQPGSSF